MSAFTEATFTPAGKTRAGRALFRADGRANNSRARDRLTPEAL